MDLALVEQGAGAPQLARLHAIAGSLAHRDHTLALLGVGSVGIERDRLDALSDLDFFVIVEAPHAAELIEDIAWLRDVAPIAFSFQNTEHGHKVLFDDGIYAEFAVFSREEAAGISATGAAVVWQREGYDAASLRFVSPPHGSPESIEFLVGEILTNLYVGLQRYHRGERLSAQRFVQEYAIDTLLKLVRATEQPATGKADAFDRSRRIEQLYPGIAAHLPSMVQGYERTVPSALAILDALKERVAVSSVMEQRIRALVANPPDVR